MDEPTYSVYEYKDRFGMNINDPSVLIITDIAACFSFLARSISQLDSRSIESG